MRLLSGCLAAVVLAGAARAQTAQPDMLQQTVAAAANPMSAWQASFSPNMVSGLRPLTVHELPPGCRPVVVALDKKPATAAGVMLAAGSRCVQTSRPGLRSGFTGGGVKAGLQTSAISGGLGGAGD
jgi:hypothetical protein